MIEYEILIPDLKIDGHPFQTIYLDEMQAFRSYDDLIKKYKNYDIVLYERRRNPIRNHIGIEITPNHCPKGHSGIIDGKNILRKSVAKHTWSCTVCGEVFKVK